MNSPAQAIGHDLKSLADHARELLAATADVAGDKVAEARKSLSSALESGKDMACHARESVMRTAKSACDSALAHPFQALGIAIGVGAAIVLATRLCTYRRD